MNKKLSGISTIAALIVALHLTGCAQMIADTLYKDQYAKPATVVRAIRASSQKAAVHAAVSAAGKTGWIPKTISVDTGYVLAEAVPDVKASNGKRDYSYRLEVRVSDNGKGDATVVVTPPTGMISAQSSEQLANTFLDALTAELTSRSR